MGRMETVQIRFPKKELEKIDKYVEKGEYPSRSEFIRDAVRKTELIRTLREMREITEEEDIKLEELIENSTQKREKLFEKMFKENE